MLLLVTRLAYRDKPLDWLSADVPASILFVVDLRGTRATIHATIAIALQDQRSLTFPIIGLEITVAVIGPAALFVEKPLFKNNL